MTAVSESAVCFTRFESLWLIAGVSTCRALGASKELTFSFFPRINFQSEMRILLLYLTVPDLIFKFMSLGNMYKRSPTL